MGCLEYLIWFCGVALLAASLARLGEWALRRNP